MGFFKDYYRCTYNNHFFEIEARSTLLGSEYSLTIDNEKRDQISYGFLGEIKLRTRIKNDQNVENVTVIINQRLFGTKFTLFINDKNILLEKVY